MHGVCTVSHNSAPEPHVINLTHLSASLDITNQPLVGQIVIHLPLSPLLLSVHLYKVGGVTLISSLQVWKEMLCIGLDLIGTPRNGKYKPREAHIGQEGILTFVQPLVSRITHGIDN